MYGMSTPSGEEREAAKLAPTGRERGRIPADTFANRLVLARKLAGLTIREAAEAAGLNYGSWSNWENGKRPQDLLDVVDRISATLDVDHEWLLFGGPLTPARGKPTKRSGATNTHYRKGPGQPMKVNVRPAPHRPKVRTDQRASKTAVPAGRRAVPVW